MRSATKTGLETGTVDQAAMLGAVIAVVLTMDQAPGPWDRSDTILGVSIGLLLVAFVRPRLSTTGGRIHLQPLAVAAIGSLCVFLILAWPLQHVFYHSITRGVERGQLTSNRVLPVVWIVATIGLYFWLTWNLQRNAPPKDAGLDTGPIAAPPTPVLAQREDSEDTYREAVTGGAPMDDLIR